MDFRQANWGRSRRCASAQSPATGKLDELERFFNRNLNDRGAKHASKFSKIYELVKRVTTTPMENLIGVSCNDNMTERLRLLCLLFDFSRKEGE